MTDPVRLREAASGADAEARAILLGDRPPVPSHAEAGRIWSDLSRRLSALPQLAPASPPAPARPGAATATGGLAGKIAIVVMTTVVGAGAWRGYRSSRAKSEGPISTGAAQVVQPASRQHAVSTANALVAGTAVVPEAQVRPATSRSARLRLTEHASPYAPRSPEPKPVRARARAHEAEQGSDAARAVNPSAQPEVAPGLSDAAPGSSWVRSALPAPTAARSSLDGARASASATMSRPPSPLWLESRRLSKVRAALRGKDPERALDLLDCGGPGSPALAQEREALTIEALAARPASRAAAAQRAQSFLRDYPDSPYRTRIEAIVSRQ